MSEVPLYGIAGAPPPSPAPSADHAWNPLSIHLPFSPPPRPVECVIIKTVSAGAIIFFGASTTGLLHIITSPYVHPTPYTLHPTPYTLHPTPSTLHPTPSSPPSSTLNPKLLTRNPKPETLNPKPETRNLEP